MLTDAQVGRLAEIILQWLPGVLGPHFANYTRQTLDPRLADVESRERYARRAARRRRG